MKILHIGNIANNAYLNAKILNSEGSENHVLSFDYYHIMGCPEWEELEVPLGIIDDFNPEWFKVNSGYSRPRWFVQGPLDLCLEYLIAYNANDSKADNLWDILSKFNKTKNCSRLDKLTDSFISLKNRFLRLPIRIARKLLSVIGVKVSLNAEILSNSEMNESYSLLTSLAPQLIYDFRLTFPDRSDELTEEDIFSFFRNIVKVKSVFKHYDVIICYGTCPYIALIAGENKFIAYEHGTIRNLPFQKTAIGRITALSYAKARSIHMTNADSTEQARALNKNIIHGCHGFIIGDAQKKIEIYKDVSILNDRLGLILKRGVKILQSTRQDWKIKGNDKFLRALVDLRKVTDDFDVIFINWGNDVDRTKKFINDHSLTGNVHWITPLSKVQLLKLYQEVDVIVDQFNIPCIGSTPLEIFAVRGGALITSLDDKMIEQFYGASIPLLNCNNSDEIFRTLWRVIKQEIDVERVKEECFQWLESTHSPDVIASHLLTAIGHAKDA